MPQHSSIRPIRTMVAVMGFPPSRDNLDWPSAPPYFFMANPPADVKIHLFFFRGAEKHRATWERDIALLPLASVTELEPYKTRWELMYERLAKPADRGLPVQVDWYPIRRGTVRAIRRVQPDLIWFYPSWLTPWIPNFAGTPCILTGPDSAVLHNERVLASDIGRTPQELRDEAEVLKRNTNLETLLANSGAKVHVVGRADARRLNQLAGRPDFAAYAPHAHFDFLPATRPFFSGGTLKILANGNAASVYFGNHPARLAAALTAAPESLRKQTSFTLLGANWEPVATALQNAGYQVTHQRWVENYAATLAEHDVALGMYAVGVGTKGKILQAMATGVLCIGSTFAMENITAQAENDYLLYERPEQIPDLLFRILQNPKHFAAVAQSGAAAVKAGHAPAIAAAEFWDLALHRQSTPELAPAVA